jgi:phosphoenolpyruvate carboxykinase (GTP)
MRVLKWMIDRIEDQASGEANAFGVCPRYEEVNWTGLAFSKEQFESVIGIDKAAWATELGLHDQLFTQLALRLPAQMQETKAAIQLRLAA